VVRVIDTEELPHSWLIRRHHTRDGWSIEGLPLPDPPELMRPGLEGMRTLAPSMDEMLREAGDTYGALHVRRFAGQRWLGVDTSTPVLSTRPGLLLGDHLLLSTAAIADMRRTDTVSLVIGPDWLHWWEAQLSEELHAGPHQLTGLPWPLDPAAAPVTIPAEFLVQWTLDPATHFACHVASGTMLGDVRVDTATNVPEPTNERPEGGKEGSVSVGAKGHPMTRWLHRVAPKRLGLKPDTASAETLLTEYEAEKETTPLAGKERTRRKRAIAQWLRDNGSGMVRS
jgi:hypothetical protein